MKNEIISVKRTPHLYIYAPLPEILDPPLAFVAFPDYTHLFVSSCYHKISHWADKN